MNAIATILGMTFNNYQLMVFDNYFLWCELNSVNDNDLQTLLSSSSLHKWFMNQYSLLELQFYANNNDSDSKTITKNYVNNTIKIGEFYPPSFLVKKIRSTSRLTFSISKYKLN